MISHRVAYSEVRPLVVERFPDATDREVELLTRYAMGVSWLETNYGYGWKGAGRGSHNMGAITGSYNGQGFQHGDSSSSGAYVTSFRKYPSRREGWKDFIRVVYRSQEVVDAAKHADTRSVSQALYDARYYLGTSKDPKTNVDRHEQALLSALGAASVELGPLPVAPGAPSGLDGFLASYRAPSSKAGAMAWTAIMVVGGFALTRARRGR